MMKDRNKPAAPAASRLSLRHTYMPKSPVDFAGPSHFGGKDDQLVLCAGKGSPTEMISTIFFAYYRRSRRYSHMGPRIRGVTASPPRTISRRRRSDLRSLEPCSRPLHVRNRLSRWCCAHMDRSIDAAFSRAQNIG